MSFYLELRLCFCLFQFNLEGRHCSIRESVCSNNIEEHTAFIFSFKVLYFPLYFSTRRRSTCTIRRCRYYLSGIKPRRLTWDRSSDPSRSLGTSAGTPVFSLRAANEPYVRLWAMFRDTNSVMRRVIIHTCFESTSAALISALANSGISNSGACS